MKVGFLITARLKSSRLPLKLLLDLNGKTVFERVIDRCKTVSNIDEIILCTSTNPQDKPLIDAAIKNNIYYYLGSESDVLQRLSDAAAFFDLDYIINITGENPLFSIYHANLVVNLAKQEKYDFINIKGLPIGCAVYGIRPEALKTVCEVKEEIDTEIWGPLINRPDIFNVKEIDVEGYFYYPHLRITTDYPEDYRFIAAIYKQYSQTAIPNLSDVLKTFKEKPDLLKINNTREQAALPAGVAEKIDCFYKNNRQRIIEIKKRIIAMIKDKLENIERYVLNEFFDILKAKLKAAANYPEHLEAPLKAIPLEYKTQDFDVTKFENHKKNIDVHYIVEGQESIGLNRIENLEPLIEYDEEGDYQHFKGEFIEQLVLSKGEFLILFPGEVHLTGGKVNNKSSVVKKIVYKVPI